MWFFKFILVILPFNVSGVAKNLKVILLVALGGAIALGVSSADTIRRFGNLWVCTLVGDKVSGRSSSNVFVDPKGKDLEVNKLYGNTIKDCDSALNADTVYSQQTFLMNKKAKRKI